MVILNSIDPWCGVNYHIGILVIKELHLSVIVYFTYKAHVLNMEYLRKCKFWTGISDTSSSIPK